MKSTSGNLATSWCYNTVQRYGKKGCVIRGLQLGSEIALAEDQCEVSFHKILVLI